MAPPPGPATDAGATRLSTLNALLDQALALPDDQRQAWLQALPEPHHALRPTLEALLNRAATPTDRFLQAPLALTGLGVDEPASPALQAGARVGPWQLLHELGTGGMSTVWLAQRVDGIRRPVALKLPHTGWSASSAARVARERDILAGLEHPRIARLYEAGVTDEGRPWLAMEYVQGLPLDLHCRSRGCDLDARLQLFLQVADAVSFAHGRMVVHRDLKPSNVMVTADGEVRLLDFGVARLLQDDDGDPDAQLTRRLGVAVTPDYAAPEQADGQPASARTDVYALGVVLYELLCGSRPYRMDSVPLPQLGEAIRQAVVAPPSARAARGSALALALQGDLDTIVARAMHPDPGQRYASVEALAADLRRHLAGEPVLARPPHWRYRAGKFIGRHRLGLSAAAAIVLALGAGLVTTTWQWLEADRQRQLALAQIARSEAAADFAGTVVLNAADRGQPITLQALLAGSERFVSATPDPHVRAMGASTLADWQINQGQAAVAEQLLARTLSSLPAGFDPDLRQQLVCQHALALHHLGRNDEAQRRLLAALELLGRDAGARSFCLLTRSAIARNLNEPVLAERAAREGLATLDAAGLGFPLRRAMLTGELGYAHSLQGRAAEADAAYASALRQLQRLGRAETAAATDLLNDWANARSDAGNPRGAIELLEQSVALTRRRSVAGDGAIGPLHNLASALRVLGRCDEAEPRLQEVLALARQAGAVVYQVLSQVGLASCALRAGRNAQAQTWVDQAWRDAGDNAAAAHTPMGEALRMIQADVWLDAQQRLADAHGLLTQVIDAHASQAQNVAPPLAFQLRGEVATRLGRVAEGRRDLDRALAQARAQAPAGRRSKIVGAALLALGRHHQQQGEVDAARQRLQQAHDELAGALGPDNVEARRAAALRDALPPVSRGGG